MHTLFLCLSLLGERADERAARNADIVSCGEKGAEMYTYIAIISVLTQPNSGLILPEGVACKHLVVSGAPLGRANGVYHYDEDRSAYWPNSSASAGRPGYIHESGAHYIYATDDFRTPSWVIREAIQL